MTDRLQAIEERLEAALTLAGDWSRPDGEVRNALDSLDLFDDADKWLEDHPQAHGAEERG